MSEVTRLYPYAPITEIQSRLYDTMEWEFSLGVLSSLATFLLRKRELVALLWLCCGYPCNASLPLCALCWFAVCKYGIPWSYSRLAFPNYPHYSIMVWLKRMAPLLAILLRFEKEDMLGNTFDI